MAEQLTDVVKYMYMYKRAFAKLTQQLTFR